MTIKIQCLTGPYAGRVRSFIGTVSVEVGETVDPAALFRAFVQHGWDWEVDYSAGTEEEIFLWFRAEIAARIVRALGRGLPVRFLDRQWRLGEGDSLQDVAQAVEDAIVTSGRLITIDSDDERGLVVGVRGWEM